MNFQCRMVAAGNFGAPAVRFKIDYDNVVDRHVGINKTYSEC